MDKSISLILGVVLILTGPIPNWATPEWQDFAAHIVAGEATPYFESKMLVICTLINDVENRGWNPRSLQGRWFGWRYPTEKDHRAVKVALAGGCEDIPPYIYLGNGRYHELWERIGYVGEGYVADIYKFGPWTMVGIRRKDVVEEINLELKGYQIR